MITQTIDEWLGEAVNRFGNIEMAKFTCPNCGNIASIDDFASRGLDEQLAYIECLGRHDKSRGCDWTSANVGGTKGKGRLVNLPESRQLEVFDFA